MEGNELTLHKYIEYWDGSEWKPIIWYSNKEDNEFESEFGIRNNEHLLAHSEAFDILCDNFRDVLSKTEILSRGLPLDVSKFVKDKLDKKPGVCAGASYYYVSELLELVDKEEKLFEEEVKNGVMIKLYDIMHKLDGVIDKESNLLEYVHFDDGKINEYKFKISKIEQVRKIADIVTYLVYQIRGFVEDDKIRVVFYFE